MQSHTPTVPFGPRSLALAHVAAQLTAKSATEDTPVHKWNVFRAICTARERLGVSERALAILNALLTFHPETALTGPSLIVFPSNQMLALRAHGMTETTLRRHLAALVDAGLIIRRDSPNGKRYARKRERAGEGRSNSPSASTSPRLSYAPLNSSNWPKRCRPTRAR